MKEDSMNDVELTPHANSDSTGKIEQFISPEIFSLYEVYSYKHAKQSA